MYEESLDNLVDRAEDELNINSTIQEILLKKFAKIHLRSVTTFAGLLF